MSRLVLVRHGETVWHAENRYAGRSDVALTANGLKQAQTLAEWARSAKLEAVWSSPLTRARLTALPAAAAAGKTLQVDPRLAEMDFGRGEGKTAGDMVAEFPAAWEAFIRDPAANPLPEGEEPSFAAERGLAALYSIARESGGGRSLVVAHNTILRLVLCKLMQIPLSRYRTTFPGLANGAITEIAITAAGAAILSFNERLGD